MMTFWKLQGMIHSQGKMPTLDKIRIETHNKTILLVHRRDYSNEAYTIQSMVIFEGTSYTPRSPIFETKDRATAVTKLQEFF